MKNKYKIVIIIIFLLFWIGSYFIVSNYSYETFKKLSNLQRKLFESKLEKNLEYEILVWYFNSVYFALFFRHLILTIGCTIAVFKLNKFVSVSLFLLLILDIFLFYIFENMQLKFLLANWRNI